jgi:spore photoproduct lyase
METEHQPHNNVPDPTKSIRRIYVAEDCLDLPYTQEILDRIDSTTVEVLPAARLIGSSAIHDPKSFADGKRSLLLDRNRGKFFKACPGTREYECCGYQVLNVGMNCPMDCVYCILQAYLNNPWLSFFVNVEELFEELDSAFAAEPERFWRIGTGEFTDSLALDRLTGLSRRLVAYMRDKPRAVLELKTKTAEVDNLMGLDHGGRTIVAWSLNSRQISDREELHTASLAQRLAAAARCADEGYMLGFHFDPIIYHPGWQEGYEKTINRLFAAVDVESIAWISLGCLRFLPVLRSIATERFPGSRFFHEEFVQGLDGKNRYFRSLRKEMYSFLVERIMATAPDTCVYLCMESEEIWYEVFGFVPADQGGLATMLDKAVFAG